MSLIMISDSATSLRPWQPCAWVKIGTWAGVGGNCQLWAGEVDLGISPSKTQFSFPRPGLKGQELESERLVLILPPRITTCDPHEVADMGLVDMGFVEYQSRQNWSKDTPQGCWSWVSWRFQSQGVALQLGCVDSSLALWKGASGEGDSSIISSWT